MDPGRGRVKGQYPYAYGKSKFQNWNFQILNADLNSLRKSMDAEYFSFFDILMGSCPKLGKFLIFALLFKLTLTLRFDCNFDRFLSEYWKKNYTLLSYFFTRNSNLKSDLKNSNFKILAFHRAPLPLTHLARGYRDMLSWIFLFQNVDWLNIKWFANWC